MNETLVISEPEITVSRRVAVSKVEEIRKSNDVRVMEQNDKLKEAKD